MGWGGVGGMGCVCGGEGGGGVLIGIAKPQSDLPENRNQYTYITRNFILVRFDDRIPP
jgi:hypothetical protein